MNEYDLIIIGAGAAGLMAAHALAGSGRTVCIIEKNDGAGRKLLISGSTQCNITHTGDMEEFLTHYGAHGRFVKPALFNFTNNDLVGFFIGRGLDVIENGNGKIFPASMKAKDVLAVLLEEAASNKAAICYGESVKSILKSDDRFEVVTDKRSVFSKKIIIATGGLSYPKTGSTGDGYTLAETLGHIIEKPAPALTPLIVRNYQFTGCSGISFPDAKISLFRNGKKIAATQGDILLTHKGLSGPGVLDFSRNVLPGDAVKISLLDYDSIDRFENDLVKVISANGKKTVKNILAGYMVPERVLLRILEINKIPADLNVSKLDRKSRRIIAEQLCELSFEVASLGDFNEAMVTRGGVALGEVNSKTMESRIVKGLYFAGEVLDVDGDTGGYNLQFAFSSGFLAGRSSMQ